mmetsp:Transcript_90310/g.200632  ORF Transcript_90310/g.200632 Transcript_90310/m.200632 type:complete len:232 (-) Transcript_90310:401-1096(-)
MITKPMNLYGFRSPQCSLPPSELWRSLRGILSSRLLLLVGPPGRWPLPQGGGRRQQRRRSSWHPRNTASAIALHHGVCSNCGGGRFTRPEQALAAPIGAGPSHGLISRLEQGVFLEAHPTLKDGLVASPQRACAVDRVFVEGVIGRVGKEEERLASLGAHFEVEVALAVGSHRLHAVHLEAEVLALATQHRRWKRWRPSAVFRPDEREDGLPAVALWYVREVEKQCRPAQK